MQSIYIVKTIYKYSIFTYFWISTYACSPTTTCTNFLCFSILKVNLHTKLNHSKVSKLQTLSIRWQAMLFMSEEEQRGFLIGGNQNTRASPPDLFCFQQPLCNLNCSPERAKQHHLRQCYIMKSHFCLSAMYSLQKVQLSDVQACPAPYKHSPALTLFSPVIAYTWKSCIHLKNKLQRGRLI